LDAADPVRKLDLPRERTRAACAIGLADAAEGEDSFAFGWELARELGRAGVRVHVALLAYDALPGVTPSQQKALGELDCAISRHAVSAAGALFPGLERGENTLLLLLGAPALASFAPALAVLLAAEGAPASMPTWLRALRGSVHLELPTGRAGLATALAQQLLARGFLPRA
jgi:hypothetical protein